MYQGLISWGWSGPATWEQGTEVMHDLLHDHAFQQLRRQWSLCMSPWAVRQVLVWKGHPSTIHAMCMIYAQILMNNDMFFLRQCQVHSIDRSQYAIVCHKQSFLMVNIPTYKDINFMIKAVQFERMVLSAQASPLPYLQANRFALCEGPGILRLGRGRVLLGGKKCKDGKWIH